MAKYLIKVSYSADGTKGLLKEGGSRRRSAVEQMIKGLGGKLEAFYFAFGDTDAIAIMDVPDAASAVAMGLTVNAAGAAHGSMTVLITPEEVDEASKKSVTYRPPGA